VAKAAQGIAQIAGNGAHITALPQVISSFT
jgi:hypothetical protein